MVIPQVDLAGMTNFPDLGFQRLEPDREVSRLVRPMTHIALRLLQPIVHRLARAADPGRDPDDRHPALIISFRSPNPPAQVRATSRLTATELSKNINGNIVELGSS